MTAVCHQEVIDDDGIILGACDRPDVIARRLDPEDGHTYPVCPGHAVGPLRVQQRRTKGWRKPEGAVAVGRGTKWGNPFRIGSFKESPRGLRWWCVTGWRESRSYIGTQQHARQIAADMFRDWTQTKTLLERDWHWALIRRHAAIREALAARDLAGKDLMCWCPLDQPCHADVLLDLANDIDHLGARAGTGGA